MDELKLHSLTPGIKEIERCLEWALVPRGIGGNVLAIIQSGGAKTASCTGWTRTGYTGKDNVFQPAWTSAEGENIIEVSLVAERLNRPTLDIIATVIHEACHVVATARGIKDCAKSGRHNKLFQSISNEFGLLTLGLDEAGKPIDKVKGYGQTALSPELQQRVIDDFQPSESAFNVLRTIINKDKTKQPPRFWCEKDNQTVIGNFESQTKPETNILCGFCMQKMVIKPPKVAGE